jgi:hypothetical protein
MGGQTEADYAVLAELQVPGLGLTLDRNVTVGYIYQLPLGQWINIFSFTGLPVGDFMVVTPLQVNSGQLWNGLAASLGTPVITPLSNAPGTARFFLEQNTSNQGPIPIAIYDQGAMTITAAAIPEPQTLWLCSGGLLLIVMTYRRRLPD